MPGKFLRHTLMYSLTLFVAISVNFFLPRAMPGDPLALIAGEAVRQMGAERVAELRQAYGLDRPLVEQYLVYLGKLAQGDLGRSYRYSGGQSVVQVIADRLGWTFFLVTLSLSLATLAGSLLGIWSAWRRGRTGDLGLLGLLFTLKSMPPFWLAMILIPIFAIKWRMLPSGDSYSTPRPDGLAGLLDVLQHAILPVTVLSLSYLPTAFAIMRTSMLGVLQADYIRTARAKGLNARGVLLRHALRNSLLPVITSFTLDFGQLLGGVTLIEIVFNYRGLGSMMFEAVKSRDYPLLQGGFLAFTLGVLALNLITDQLYPLLDPRLRGRRA
ncbi:MAG TPA: ABC transporter permease [Anaerolineales bacterium]|nr:ABC transporter permease [Anaerolineales bacterium]